MGFAPHDIAGWTELSRRRERTTDGVRDVAADGTRKWQALFADVTASLDADPAGLAAQALLDRWRALVDEFTGGHRDIAEGLGRAWQDRENWSEGMKQQTAEFGDPRVWEFIRRAGEARKSSPQ